MKRVVLVDDHQLVRAGLRALIEGFGDYAVVGEAADGRAAIDVARALLPEIIVLDISMPELNGIDAIPHLRRVAPQARIVMVSMHASPLYARAALDAGASGFVVKDAGSEDLRYALARAADGGVFVSASLPMPLPAAAERTLTRRQREILQLIAEGVPTRDIAERLFISVKTAESHRVQIMERLDIHDVAGLTRYALRIGLIAEA